MKKIITLAIWALCALAHSAPVPVFTPSGSPAPWYLFKGSVKQTQPVPTYVDLASCQAGMAALAVASQTAIKQIYHCKSDTAITVTASPGPQPQGEFQMLSCPAGSAPGSQWQQTRDYVPSKKIPFWVATAWTPLAPQTGACPPAPPPPSMHAGLEVSDDALAAINALAVPGVSDVELIPAVADCTVSPTAYGCPPETLDAAAFRTVCELAGAGRNDAIVYPGSPGMAHPHLFFGNTNASLATLSPAILNQGNSTCRGGAIIKSGMWVPALLEFDPLKLEWTPWVPKGIILYYKAAPWTDWKQVAEIPAGLRMIAGNPMGNAPVRFGNVGWSCNGFAQGSDASPDFENGNQPHKIPKCAVGQEVWSSVGFPYCWDGINLDSPDHKSHVIFAPSPFPPNELSNGCPPDHPVLLPQVTFQVMWAVPHDYDPKRMAVSSDVYKKGNETTADGGYGMHGDYFANWPVPGDPNANVQEDFQGVWNAKCIRAHKDCDASKLGDGRTLNSFQGN